MKRPLSISADHTLSLSLFFFFLSLFPSLTLSQSLSLFLSLLLCSLSLPLTLCETLPDLLRWECLKDVVFGWEREREKERMKERKKETFVRQSDSSFEKHNFPCYQIVCYSLKNWCLFLFLSLFLSLRFEAQWLSVSKCVTWSTQWVSSHMMWMNVKDWLKRERKKEKEGRKERRERKN